MINSNKAKLPLAAELWKREVEMYSGLLARTIGLLAAIQAMLMAGILLLLIYRTQDTAMVLSYAKALVFSKISPSSTIDISWYGAIHSDGATHATIVLGQQVHAKLVANAWTAVKYSFAGWLVFPYMLRRLIRSADSLIKPRYISGARYATIKEIRRNVKRAGGGSIGIGPDLMMAHNIENEHFFAIGRTSSGKTSLAKQLIADLRKRDAKAVIHDPQGGILSSFYDDKKDIIFNPADKRHCGWSIIRELGTYMDIEAVSHSLIPEAQNQDFFWHNAARGVFSGCLTSLYLAGEKRNAAIWEFLQRDGSQVTAALKKIKHPGWKYIEDASSKQALSVFATLQQFVQCFEIMGKSDGDFTVTNWLNDQRGGFIYITNYEDIRDAMRPTLSLFIDLMGRRLLSMPNSDSRRVFFIIDELAALQKLPTLISLLTRSRAKGGCCFLYNQEVSPLDRRYSKQERDSIMNNCGTKIIMPSKDPTTADFCSKLIGETEIEEAHISTTLSQRKNHGGVSVSRKNRVKPLVLPSTIQHELGVGANGNKDYSFYLLLNHQHVIKTTTKRMDLPSIAPEFILRDDLRLDHIKADHDRLQLVAEERQATAEKEKGAQQAAVSTSKDWITQGKKGIFDFRELDF